MPRLSPEQRERFRRVAWPWLPMVLRTAQYLCGSESEAEDLAQETMLKAARGIDQFREGTDAKAWLLTILRRVHIDAVRAKRVRPREVAMEPEAVEALPDERAPGIDADWSNPRELLERFEDQAVIEALKSLPEEIRWTLMLADVEQLDQARVAEVLGVPVGTVKSRVHRGRGMLRERLMVVARERGWVKRAEESRHE
jgi:RNA polymerase sigma-70 factor (ECF subfamily)